LVEEIDHVYRKPPTNAQALGGLVFFCCCFHALFFSTLNEVLVEVVVGRADHGQPQVAAHDARVGHLANEREAVRLALRPERDLWTKSLFAVAKRGREVRAF